MNGNHPFIKLLFDLAKNGMNLQGIVTTLLQRNPNMARFLDQAQRMAQGKNDQELEIFVTNYARENRIPEWVINRAKHYAKNPSMPISEVIQSK